MWTQITVKLMIGLALEQFQSTVCIVESFSALLPVTTDHRQFSHCLLEVGKWVEKKYFHVQQPTRPTNQWLKRCSWRLFPQMSHFFLKRGFSQNSIQSTFNTWCSLSGTICDKKCGAGFSLFPWKGFMVVHVLPNIPACMISSKSISPVSRLLQTPQFLHVSCCFCLLPAKHYSILKLEWCQFSHQSFRPKTDPLFPSEKLDK